MNLSIQSVCISLKDVSQWYNDYVAKNAHIQKPANREGYPRRKFYVGRKNGLSRGNFCPAVQEILEFFVLISVVYLEKF